MAKTAKKESVDLLSQIKSGASTAPKSNAKKKSGKVVHVPESLQETIDKYVAAKKQLKALEAELTFHESEILDHAKSVQDDDAFKGDFSKSFDLPGKEAVVKFVTQNRFSINAADREIIESLLGSDYSELIEEKYSVSLKDEVLKDEDKLAELGELLGEKFGEYFESRLSLGVQNDFDKKIYRVAGSPEKLQEVRTYVKQYKPSLRS